MEQVMGWAEQGGSVVTIPGTQGSGAQRFQQSFRSATVTVRDSSNNLATIYSDDLATPTAKANPFTASSTTGSWNFFTTTGTYTLTFSGGSILAPFSITVNVGLGNAGGVPSYAFASLPTSKSQNAGDIARVTNVQRGLWMDSGSQWFSLSGRVINLEEFGLSTSNADNGALMNTAIGLASDGDTLLLPVGTFNCTTLISVTKNVKIKGAGNAWFDPGGGSQLRQTTAAGIISLDATCILENISMGGPGGSAYGIRINHSQVIIDRCSIDGGCLIGIEKYSSNVPSWVNIRQCYISGCTTFGLDQGGGNAWRIENNVFYNNGGTDIRIGQQNGSASINITGNSFDKFVANGNTAICVDIDTNQGFQITGNYFELTEDSVGGVTGQLAIRLSALVRGGVIGANFINGNGSLYGIDLRSANITTLSNIEFQPNFSTGFTTSLIRISGYPGTVNRLSIGPQMLGTTPALADTADLTANCTDWVDTAGVMNIPTGLFLKNGTVAAPSWSFFGDQATGPFRGGGSSIAWAFGGVCRMEFENGDLQMRDSANICWTSGAPNATSPDLILQRAAANIGRQINGSAAQEWRWHGNATEYTSITHNGTDAILRATTGDVQLLSNSGGVLRFGTLSGLAGETLSGYLTVKTAAGVSIKLGVIS